MNSVLWMLSGQSGAGKTTFCRHLATIAAAEGWQVGGLLSAAVMEHGCKAGIQALDLRHGAVRLLAQAAPANPDGLHLGNWSFDEDVFPWGDAALRACLPCDLLVMDELGPLELLLDKGWQAALEVLNGQAYRLGIVVIRPHLQQQACQRLPISRTLILEEGMVSEAQVRSWWRKEGLVRPSA